MREEVQTELAKNKMLYGVECTVVESNGSVCLGSISGFKGGESIPKCVDVLGTDAAIAGLPLEGFSLVVPSSIRRIGAYAFRNSSITEFIANSGHLMAIGRYSFSNSALLNRAVLPEGLVSIGRGAFEDCSNLVDVNFPKTLESIGISAFSNCGLRWVTVGSNIDIVGERAFESCFCLEELFWEASCGVPAGAFKHSALSSVNLGDILPSIGDNAFCSCRYLHEVRLPSGCTNIGVGAFRGCTGLREITFGTYFHDCVLMDSAFADCTSLEVVRIPYGLALTANVFAGCRGLKCVYLYIGVNIFDAYNVFVGCESLSEIHICGTSRMHSGADSPSQHISQFRRIISKGFLGSRHSIKVVIDRMLYNEIECLDSGLLRSNWYTVEVEG